jgi:hypothetical protein
VIIRGVRYRVTKHGCERVSAQNIGPGIQFRRPGSIERNTMMSSDGGTRGKL